MSSVRVFLVVLLLLGVSLLFVNLGFISAEQEGGRASESVHFLHEEVQSTDTTRVVESTEYERISFSVALESEEGDDYETDGDKWNLVGAEEPRYQRESEQKNDSGELFVRSTGEGAEKDVEILIWPQPKSLRFGKKIVSVSLSLPWEVKTDCPVFYKRVSSYKDLLKDDLRSIGSNSKSVGAYKGTPNSITGLRVIHVDDPEGTWEERVHDEYYPDGDMPFGYNEHYILRIPDGGEIEIEVSCFYGFVAAMSTLKQVFAYEDETKLFFLGAPLVVQDEPAFPHRGFMIDTGRSFLSLGLIRQTIDAMSLLKLNVLHWHLVDDQSFAVECEEYPQLSRDGAYWMGYVWDHVPIDKGRYTQDDLRGVVAYAARRGIRVVPEVDLPGHCRGWSIAFPNMTVECPKYQADKRNIQNQNKFMNGDYHVNMPLDVTNPFALNVVATFLEEMGSIFEDPAFHVGSDEPPEACWHEDRRFMSRMAAISQHLSPHAYMLQQVREMFRTSPALVNRTLTIWDDGVSAMQEAGMGKERNVVQFWRSWGSSFTRSLPDIAADSLLILSPSSWYLDIPKAASAITDWKATYNDVTFSQLAASVKKTGHLIGGEACAWMMTESYQVSRQGTWPIHYNTLVWHRLIAIAERLWSGTREMPPGTEARYGATKCLVRGLIEMTPDDEMLC